MSDHFSESTYHRHTRHEETQSPYLIDWPANKGKPPVVVQVIPNLNAGGAEQGCIDMTSALVQSGAKALVVTNGGARAHEVARQGGQLIHMPVHSKNPFVIWKNITRMERLIKEHKVDIIHVRSRAPAWSAYFAAKRTGAKFMTTFHAAYKYGSSIKRKYNAIMTKGERVIAISHFIADHIIHNYDIIQEKIRIVHRGTALERFHPNAVSAERMIKLTKDWNLPEDKAIILLPARLTRIKGHRILIDALSKMEHKNFHCLLVGGTGEKSHYRKELEGLIEKLEMGDVIKIHDHCMDMPAAYRMATVVVAPSIVPEGFGRIPIEAQAMGRPVITTNIGATSETVLDGETGWLIPPKDSAALAKALTEALKMTDRQRASMGTKAMAFVAGHFSTEEMCQSTLSVYAELLEE